MIRTLVILALLGLSSCQGIVSPTSGRVEGITVPPGCKGSFSVIVSNSLIVNASLQGSCDETGATQPTMLLRLSQ